MANYALAILKNAQTKVTSAFQNGEFRYLAPEVHTLFTQNSNNAIQNYQELVTRQDRVVEATYLLRSSRSVAGNPMTHTLTGTVGDSAIITPTFIPYYDEFAITLKGSDNKILTQEEIALNELQNSFINVVNGLEAVAQSTLFSNRSTTNTINTDGTFNPADDVFMINESTNGEQAMSITEMVMRLNGWNNVTIVADPIAYRKFRSQRNQGVSNATNTSFQFENITVILAPTFATSFSGLAGAYSRGSWIAVPSGTVAMLPWIPVQNRSGYLSEGVAQYGSIINPIDNISLATYTYQTRADGTALGGSLQDVETQNQIGLMAAHIIAPITGAAGETPLQAFVLV